MASQLDFIVASGIFIIVVAFVVLFSTNHLTSIESEIDIMVLRSKAISILDGTYNKKNINSTVVPDLFSNAYHFFIFVNNTNKTLVNEEVYFNYTEMGFENIDYNSTVIYDGDAQLAYEIDKDRVFFLAGLLENQTKYFDVYFDDDSNFTDRSSSLSGVNNLSEVIYSVNEIQLVQYKKIQELNSTSYIEIAQAFENDFKLTLSNEFNFGPSVPKKSNIVSLKRDVLYQNKTASIKNGELIVNVW